jgi:hypothetical protein
LFGSGAMRDRFDRAHLFLIQLLLRRLGLL